MLFWRVSHAEMPQSAPAFIILFRMQCETCSATKKSKRTSPSAKVDWNQLPADLILQIAIFVVNDVVARIGCFDIIYEEKLEKEAEDLGAEELSAWMQEHYGTGHTDRDSLDRQEMTSEHVRGIERGDKLLFHLDVEDEDVLWLTSDEIARGVNADPGIGGMWTLHLAICKDTGKLYASLEQDPDVWVHVGKMVSRTIIGMHPQKGRALTCSLWILCACYAWTTNVELLSHAWIQMMFGLGEAATNDMHTAPAVLMTWEETRRAADE